MIDNKYINYYYKIFWKVVKMLWEQEVAGSNPATPTAKSRVSEGQLLRPFFICTKFA